MYKYISSNREFSDLQSDLAKTNYNRLISSLESAIRPNVSYSVYYVLGTKFINKSKFEKYLKYLCDRVFSDEKNNLIVEDLIKNRIDFELDGYPYGFTSYDINKEKMIIIKGGKYKVSPVIAVHELTHAIMFLQKNSIPKEYEEFLSMFNELRAIDEMGADIQDEWLFNRIVQRLSYRIHIEDLSDEALQTHQISNDIYFEKYFRILSFVCALRLHEIYLVDPEQVNADVLRVLNNQISLFELLNKYKISLENEDTILCFENKIVEYENIVTKYFNDFQKI